ncbi:hypothetical protein BGP78_09785 [Pseudoalteromonas sp. MSK9-3]|uniref:hypothetical protein n=1 Tax=Pseudoalteromonas sp. MSK9-3 TaxID=1897633 RepID=UPI000E6C4002|nr:hypothetical protein [Pseudoalteromonas sp. MSK9-3]RJE77182.1 hypothetical protein BGP78_09785 [Pseudoalteromonas sp. MSK9-3]
MFGITRRRTFKAKIRKPTCLAHFDFYECHRSQPISATPTALIRAAKEFDMHQDPYIHALMSARRIPERIIGARKNKELDPFDFNSFTPLFEDENLLSMGLIGRFWQLDMGLVEVPNKEEFEVFDDPSYAKLELRFYVEEQGNGQYILVTDTCISCPSKKARLTLTFYWLFIRLASGFIRKRTLKGIQKMLDKSSHFTQG